MVPGQARQLIVGLASDWDEVSIDFIRYERADAGAPWREIDRWPARLGYSGLAWGIGRHGDGAPPDHTGPVKQEGDGKSPAGAFAIGAAYGYADKADTRLPYTAVDDTWRCIDDPASQHYNRIVTERDVKSDWSSAENMVAGDLYRWIIVVQHNEAGSRGRGSCVFLHLWRNAKGKTAGCVAMAREKMESLLAWFDPDKAPLLVLLPKREYKSLRPAWGLP